MCSQLLASLTLNSVTSLNSIVDTLELQGPKVKAWSLEFWEQTSLEISKLGAPGYYA